MSDHLAAERRALHGGYRSPYDPTPELKKLLADINDEEAWLELWDNLHHQGDVGEASYAAIPCLWDIYRKQPQFNWNFYALVACIEIERWNRRNPPLPDWLQEEYQAVWPPLSERATADMMRAQTESDLLTIVSTIALAKGMQKSAMLLLDVDTSEMSDLLERYRTLENYEFNS